MERRIFFLLETGSKYSHGVVEIIEDILNEHNDLNANSEIPGKSEL